VDVTVQESSPARTRRSPRDGCAANAGLIVELIEPNGVSHEFVERPFTSRTAPIFSADQRLQLTYPLQLGGPFNAGAWELTLTWKHFPTGPHATCVGEIRLHTTSLELLVLQ
jgi:hypothetical protein